ncbi:hypothetical protein [Paenibacillus turpanensis]|uniref:hypothetical protein n=1 Tax=Paenibacillus turpanensis TaxID=2689078 RepID=UPI0014087F61|nr:hypothetical protein [Paenibacillus turpanensis]
MLVFFVILAIAFVGLMIGVSASGKGGSRQRRSRATRRPAVDYSAATPPVKLGLRQAEPYQALADRLEAAIPAAYADQIRQRVLTEHPEITPEAYDWYWFELKRYFAMNAVLPHVPMFSERVDVLWHEMLMFTREYQQFCDRFVGRMIHHVPNTAPTPIPHERAWFDWVYTRMFEETLYVSHIWGPMFRHPLSPDRVKALETESADQLEMTLFNRQAAEQYPEVRGMIRKLIAEAKEQTSQAAAERQLGHTRPRRAEGAIATDFAAMALVFYAADSLSEYESFAEEEFMNIPPDKRDASGCSSTFYACGSGSTSNDNGGGSGDGGSGGGDSGSGSSCGSSCGGGCSS